jgi:hypothetical protein
MSNDTPPNVPDPAPAAAAGPGPWRARADAVARFTGSFGLAVVVLSFLLVLTFLGTLAQAETSLFEVQRLYFESLIVWQPAFGTHVPLPGVYLLLVILAINILTGGIIRLRKGTATVGVFITHVGVVMLLAGGLIEFYASTKGHMTIYEGEQSDEYQSFFEWEIIVAETGGKQEWVIPGERFMTLDPEATATFEHPGLPFVLAVGSVKPNCAPRPAATRSAGDSAAVGDWFLADLPRDLQAERDIAGLYVRVKDVQGDGVTDGILWGVQRFPLTVQSGGKTWTLDLHKRRWKVPYTIRLDDFRAVLHPRAGGMAKAFESDVTQFRDGTDQRILISMNRPLRDGGYTFFQSSYREDEDGKWSSTFSVVRNPADSIPLYACIVMATGLLVHFLRKLRLHVRGTTRSVPT